MGSLVLPASRSREVDIFFGRAWLVHIKEYADRSTIDHRGISANSVSPMDTLVLTRKSMKQGGLENGEEKV
jgi:hypothetical protein